MALPEPLFYNKKHLNFELQDIATRSFARRVLAVSPDFYEVIDDKNYHMVGEKVNTERAWEQWKAIQGIYKMLVDSGKLKQYHILDGCEGCEDMVFAANQTFPWEKQNGQLTVILSNMKHPSRQREVANFESFFRREGYTIRKLKSESTLEGMGDMIPHPGRNLIYGGYGFRTSSKVYDEVAAILQTPIIGLELKDERFYHLDTCFVPINESAVMIFPDAFTPDGREKLKQFFKHIIEIPEDEAMNFALNVHAIPEIKHAIIEKKNPVTVQALEDHGYTVHEVDTSEFIKSGGSVFCMKMMFF